MNDLRYILGEPIEVFWQDKNNESPAESIGILYPLGVLDYTKNIDKFNVLNVTRNFFLQGYDVIKDKELRGWIEENVVDFDVICMSPNNIISLGSLLMLVFKVEREAIASNYKYVYEKIEQELNDGKIKEEDLNNVQVLLPYLKEIFVSIGGKRIDRNNFGFIKNMICKVNSVHLPRQAKNKELQEVFDKSRALKSKDSKQDYEDIITTIMAITGYKPKDIGDMTIYQINSLIGRINKIKEFESNISYICAGAEKIKLEPFTAHVDVNDNDEKLASDFSEYEGYMNSALSNK